MGRPVQAAPRGATLLELMTALGMMMFILVAVVAMLLTNQQQVVNQSQVSSSQASLRTAAAHIEQSLSRAGYGIDPNYAVEPAELATDTTLAGAPRDGVGLYGSDELLVRYRDPLVSAKVVSASAGSILLATDLPPGETLVRGQGLLILCSDANTVAYVTVATYTPATRQITLLAGGKFPFTQQGLLGNACFSNGNAWMTRVIRARYFIHWFNDTTLPGTMVGTEYSVKRPALMVARGLDLDGNGTPSEPPTSSDAKDAEIVALDIEQLQVAYVMNRPTAAVAANYQLTTGPDTNGDFVYGEPGSTPPNVPTVVTPSWSGGTAAPAPAAPPLLTEADCATKVTPQNTCSLGGERRYTGHPGNIRSVRFSLVGRWGKEDPSMQPTLLDLAPNETLVTRPLENLRDADVLNQPRRRQRGLRYQATVTLRNVFQRKHFVPPTAVAGNAGG